GKTKAADVFAAEATVEAAVETVEKEVAEEQVVENENSLQDETILAPVAGEVVALADVNDPVFSSGAMGQGLAIKPSEGV
ncbi:PTS glucose transporter subunit IIA, partial [Emergencia timonensis]